MLLFLKSILSILASLLGYARERGEMNEGRKEVELEQAEHEALVRKVQSQAAADATAVVVADKLADELRHNGF
jgi:hypothetical protein